MFARPFAFLLASGLVALSGCGPAKLDVEKTYTLDSGDAKIVLLDAQSKQQNITVAFESTDSPIIVLLLKDSDLQKDDDGSFMATSKAVAFKSGEKNSSFTAEVPANTASRVIIRGAASKTTVKVHITNK